MTETRKITLQFPSLRAFLAEYGERICADGMLLRGEAPPPTGSAVDIEIVVAEGMRLLRARGETLWSGAAGGGQPAAAVRFDYLDKASLTLIEKIVDQRRRGGAEPFSLDDVPGPSEARLRDLTVPTATSDASDPSIEAGAPTASIFDLAEPPADTGADLFTPLAEPGEPPLPADPAPAPFDLSMDGQAAGQELAAAGQELDAAVPAAAEPDLSDLFGSDEPQIAPARARTEAFPPSFVDEVEAELEAAETPESSHLEVDTGELEAQLGASVEEPWPAAAEAVELPVEPSPTPQAETELSPMASPEVEAHPEPPKLPEPLPLPEASPQAARAFGAEGGPETVEIPILGSPAPEATEPLPATEEAPSPVDEPPVETPPPVAMPSLPAETPAPIPAMDDNLLSIPELGPHPAAGEGAATPADLPPSAESLRGAAGRSRQLGTWLLIVLLAGALAVAGFFLLGLARGGGAPAPPETQTADPRPRDADAAPALDETLVETVESTAGDHLPVAPADEGVEPPATEAAAAKEPTAAEPAPTAAPVTLTGLNRITWSETGAETVLALVGDGEIPRENVEVVPIAGGQPRLVIKISGVERPFQPAVLEVGTAHVERVRTGLHAGGQLHVVVDLATVGVSVRDLATRGARLEVRLGAE